LAPHGYTRRRFLSVALDFAGLSLIRPAVAGSCLQRSDPVSTCDANGWKDGGRLAVEGYAMGRSYAPGEQVSLCMSARARTNATITIQRLGARTESVWTASMRVVPKAIPADASENGCGWEKTEDGVVSCEIPAAWTPGLYRITMDASSQEWRRRPGEAFFVVRSAAPGRTARVLLMVSSNTYCAYNNYGLRDKSVGSTTTGSFYDRATYASFLRPLPPGFLSAYDCRPGEDPSRQHRYAGWDKWEWPFVRWAEQEGFALDYATNEDLERQPGLLASYRLVVSVGHDEYWSAGMREAIDGHVRTGGNVVFLSGNVSYRKVRIDHQGARLVLAGEMDGDALWSHRRGANRPENHTTGVSFCYGALNPDPVPYTIYQPHHWVFSGLWPAGGKLDSFPQIGCIGYECDGCDLEWVRGVPVASHRDGTPEGFQVLGLAPGRMPDYEARVHSNALFGRNDGFTPWGKDMRQGGAVLGLWMQGGTVVTVGCTEWVRHLGDPLVAQITRNILTRLSV
jgi:hypothetical protein